VITMIVVALILCGSAIASVIAPALLPAIAVFGQAVLSWLGW
jgi:threonine/homoserine/homoserine lactone efflux protein